MGVTVSSLVSLSLEPPLVGVSIGKQASVYELLRNAGGFARQHPRRRPGGARPPLRLRPAADRALDGRRRRARAATRRCSTGALGWLEARTLAEHDAGDHTFFIAAVESVERGPAPSALMYRDRAYHSL